MQQDNPIQDALTYWDAQGPEWIYWNLYLLEGTRANPKIRWQGGSKEDFGEPEREASEEKFLQIARPLQEGRYVLIIAKTPQDQTYQSENNLAFGFYIKKPTTQVGWPGNNNNGGYGADLHMSMMGMILKSQEQIAAQMVALERQQGQNAKQEREHQHKEELRKAEEAKKDLTRRAKIALRRARSEQPSVFEKIARVGIPILKEMAPDIGAIVHAIAPKVPAIAVTSALRRLPDLPQPQTDEDDFIEDRRTTAPTQVAAPQSPSPQHPAQQYAQGSAPVPANYTQPQHNSTPATTPAPSAQSGSGVEQDYEIQPIPGQPFESENGVLTDNGEALLEVVNKLSKRLEPSKIVKLLQDVNEYDDQTFQQMLDALLPPGQ